MRASFFEFNVAMSGLFSARANLNVVSHNISNAAIKGYSRQYAEQRASRPMTFYDGKGMVGTGSEVYGIGQMRDFYLDQEYWAERSIMGDYSVKRTQLSMIEKSFGEMPGTGLTTAFNEFFSRIQDLSTTTPDSTYRTNVLNIGQTLVTFVNNTAEVLKKQQNDVNREVKSMVQVINNLGQQIVSINKQISQFELDGSKANDLRDQRARIVDELSKYVNIEVTEEENNADYAKGLYPEPEDRGKSDKRFSILINGYDFINHNNINYLETRDRAPGDKRNPMDAEQLSDVYFTNGTKFDIYNKNLRGDLKGLIDVRDGNNGNAAGGTLPTTDYKGIPHYLNRLNELVRTFARAINEGKDRNGGDIPSGTGKVIGHVDAVNAYGTTGNYMFTFKGGPENTGTTLNYNDITCENFVVNPALVSDPSLVGCGEKNIDGESDNRATLSWINIGTYKTLFREGKLSDFIISVSGELAIDLKQATKFEKNYNDVVMSIDNQRMAVSGVDMNEEMVNMVKYQQQYQAASRLINVINNIYETLINRVGV